jgi:hypothetical protein
MSKITKSTFKAFLRKNPRPFIKVGSSFDPMVDCVTPVGDSFKVARDANYPCENNLGLAGVWLVGGSRDYFTEYADSLLRGIRVSNCCGSFTVAVKA